MDLEETKNQLYWQMLKMRVWEERIEQVFLILRENNVEPILFKGWSISRFYPNKFERPFSDIDLIVKQNDFDLTKNILDENKIIDVDLHSDLGHLDYLNFETLYQNSELVDCVKQKVRIISIEDNLRIACVHWLIDGGEYRWKLQDIKYLVENRPKDFDWQKCLDVVNLKRQKWVLVAIALSHRYFDTDINDLPFAEEIKKKDFIPKWLIKSLEKTWSQQNVGLVGLHKVLFEPKELLIQIKKRFPPNPIQATIELEGSIDNTPRFFYQFADIFWRIPPLFIRLFGKILRSKRLQNYKW